MYIYLIKYYDEVIAAAENDEKAAQVIMQYMRNNKDMDINQFDKVPIRFFGNTTEDCQACIIEKTTGFTVQRKEKIK